MAGEAGGALTLVYWKEVWLLLVRYAKEGQNIGCGMTAMDDGSNTRRVFLRTYLCMRGSIDE